MKEGLEKERRKQYALISKRLHFSIALLVSIAFAALYWSSNSVSIRTGGAGLLSKMGTGVDRGERRSKLAKMCGHPLWMIPYVRRFLIFLE